ncbi:MAG: hypothetical protein K5755_00575 [Clostridiales bacterium]|nr:hypothetical protein [Clostridiales bacterium]
MALVRCYECSATISDKADCCPHCGAPIAKVGVALNEIKDNAQSNTNSTHTVVKKSKKTIHYFGLALFITLCIGFLILVFVLESGKGNTGSSSKETVDPNRTKEYCSYYGETRVFPSGHADCIPDGDGYYNPAFGHHHHK